MKQLWMVVKFCGSRYTAEEKNGSIVLCLLSVFLNDKEIKHLPGFFRTILESLLASACWVVEMSCKQPASVSPPKRDKGVDQMPSSA